MSKEEYKAQLHEEISSKPLTNEVVDWIMYKCSEFEEIYGEVLIVNIEVKNLQGRLIS